MVVRSRQAGSALIISLVFLLLLSLIGVASIQSSSLQERMAGNAADKNYAFQAAEAGLRAAELLLQTNVSAYSLESVSVIPTTDIKPTATGWAQVAVQNIDAANSPYYRIQRTVCATGNGCQRYYLVTAIGYGKEPGTRVVLQTTYLP